MVQRHSGDSDGVESFARRCGHSGQYAVNMVLVYRGYGADQTYIQYVLLGGIIADRYFDVIRYYVCSMDGLWRAVYY